MLLLLADRVAYVDRAGKHVFTTALPDKTRLSGYVPADDAFVLATRVDDNTHFGFLSRRIAPRFLNVRRSTGAYGGSIPHGPLEAAAPRIAERNFQPVAGCRCALADGRDVQLVYAEDARRNDALGLVFAFDLAGTVVRLAPYENQWRLRIAPPPWILGEVGIGMACGRDTVVVRSDRVATGWALVPDRDPALPDFHEAWTIEVPPAGKAAETSLGGAAKLRCYGGKVDGLVTTFDDRGIASIVTAPEP